MNEIHAIVLTLNEEMHIARCIKSLSGQCTSITVVDSGSTDKTVEIAKDLGASVLSNRWINHATQMNFGIEAVAERGGWILRIDADEVLDTDSPVTLREAVVAAGKATDGLLVARRIHFLGRRIRYGGIEPSWQLRLWRNGKGRCEQRWMDEHIKVAGRVEKTGLVLSDINLNSLTWWTRKHNKYSSLEVIEVLNRRHRFFPREQLGIGSSRQARARRFMKEHVYGKTPGGLRAFAYFLYRYILRFGFLDGLPGYYFHVMQGLWYRTLVDAKIVEIEARAAREGMPIVEAIEACTGIDPTVDRGVTLRSNLQTREATQRVAL